MSRVVIYLPEITSSKGEGASCNIVKMREVQKEIQDLFLKYPDAEKRPGDRVIPGMKHTDNWDDFDVVGMVEYSLKGQLPVVAVLP